jgi:predicted nucleic acid-binding protein
MDHSPTTLVWVTPADVERAKTIIYQYDDKDFSLTDATSFAVMERIRVPAASPLTATLPSTASRC